MLGKSDPDSGDEEAPEFSNLGSCQLLTGAMVEVQDETGLIVIGGSSNEEEKITSTKSQKRRLVTYYDGRYVDILKGTDLL